MLRRPYDEQPGREALRRAPPRLGARPRRLLDAVVQLVNDRPRRNWNAFGWWRWWRRVLAIMLRWLMDPLLGNRVPFATFFIAIVLAVRYGNQWAALARDAGRPGMGRAALFPGRPVRPRDDLLLGAVPVLRPGDHRARPAHARGRTPGRGPRAGSWWTTCASFSASQGRLQLATEVSGTGVFQWDVRADRFEGENPEAYRIFGRKPDMPKLTMAEFFERHVHPDDAASVQRELRAGDAAGRALPGRVPLPPRRGRATTGAGCEVVGRFLFDEGSTPTQLIGVITDITERREMEDDLRRMAADLSDADHRKDEFLATLAHELRNPLAPIRNGIELLKRGAGGNAQTQSAWSA